MNGPSGSATPFSHLLSTFALRRSAHGRRRPDVLFPTASERVLSQDTWQLGPDAGAALLGKNFITYAFVQQWFKIGETAGTRTK